MKKEKKKKPYVQATQKNKTLYQSILFYKKSYNPFP
jgi:hypothetical protein